MMGFPGEIRQITNPKTQQVEVVQTCMIVVELQSNQWGYGINLNDSDGVVRIEGKRPNSDGTPSPAQQNSNIEKGDVIYKVQNVVLGRNNPLNVAVQTMQQSNVVKLTLLRHVPLSNTKSKIRMEPQVYCDLNQEQLFQLQYQILVLRYLQSKRMPDRNILINALGFQNSHYLPKQNKTTQPYSKKPKKKKHHYDSESDDDDDDYHMSYVATDAPRRSLRNKTKKHYNIDNDDLEKEDEKYQQEIREANEERKNESEVLKKIELIVGGRYRIRPETNEEELELLIKWTNQSYYHLDWIWKSDFEALGQGAVFRCRHYITKNNLRIEHFGANDKLPIDSEYYDPEYALIDRVLWIREMKNTDGYDPTKFELMSTFDKVAYTLNSPLLTYFYTPYKIYLLQLYLKSVKDLNGRRKMIKGTLVEGEDKSEELAQLDELEKQYELLLPEIITMPALQKLVLVKWNNQTYDQVTWEKESDVHHEQSKIIAFHRINRLPNMNSIASSSDSRPSPDKYKQYQSIHLKNNVVLREYQVEGVNWLIFSWYQRRNCILADEMGLGKTLQSIALLNHFFTKENIRGPFLVLAPLSTLGHWKREIENATDLNVVQYHSPHGGEESRERIRQYEFNFPNCDNKSIYKFNVLLTTYNILMSDLDILQDIHWKYLIIDEAQRAKSQNTKLFLALKQIRADAKLLLTGTPLQNNMNELWSLLNFIEPSKFASENEFISRFGNLTDANQVADLHTLLRPYFLRRVKSDVEKNIPPKIETVIDIELTTLQKKYYRAIYDRNRSFLEFEGSSMAQLVSIVTELRKCCNHPFMIRGVVAKETHNSNVLYNQLLIKASGKFLLLSKLLPKLYEEKHQVLIFSQFINTLDLLEDLLALLGYTFDRLDGGVRGDLRQQKIDKFNSGKVFAFLLSTKAGGLGLNLTAADTVIIFDNDWNPQNDVQAEARAHRIGQQKEVHVYRLVTKGTYEQELFSRASRKLGLSQAVFDSGLQNHFRGSTIEDTSSLFDIDVKKIEQLLKFGAFAFADTGENENTIENSTDINEFMKKNSYTYVIKETPEGEERKIIEGEEPEPQTSVDGDNQLRFNQAYFVSKDSNTEVDFKDPQFWDKVLGPRVGERLLRELEKVLDSKDIKEIADYIQDLNNLVVEVVNEKMSGNIHSDYNNLLDILHTLSMSEFYFGSLDMGELAGRWKEVIELKGRQLRRKKMEHHSYTAEGLTINVVEFSDSEQNTYKEKWEESESETASTRRSSKRGRKPKAEIDDTEKPRKRRKRQTEENNNCDLVIRLTHHKNDQDESFYTFDQVVVSSETEKKRGTADNDKATHRVKKNRVEVYFDMTNEISKVSYENYQATCHTMKRENWYCCVCFGDDCSDQNPLFQCAKCGCIVHKYCYGIDQMQPDPNWLCDYCSYIQTQNLPWKGDELSCPLCYYTGGAYKQAKSGRWIHALCAVWASEIRFGDEVHMKNITGLDKIPDNIFRYKCYLCHKNGSYTIKCMSSVCTRHFHPMCGRRNAVRMEYVPNEGLQAFCDKHGKKKRVKVPRKKNSSEFSDHEDSYQEDE